MDRFVLTWKVACLCHPNWQIRQIAAAHLERMDRHQHLLPPLSGLVHGGGRRDLILRVLAAGGVESSEATETLLLLLRYSKAESLLRIAAAYALGILGPAEACAVLLHALDDAPPELYLAATHALAQLDPPLVVPLLAALALDAPFPAPQRWIRRFPAAASGGGFDVPPLLRAHAWLHSPIRARPAGSPISPVLPSEVPVWKDELAALECSFARDVLWDTGEVAVLTALQGLAAGDADRVAAADDPRLYEAMVVGLLGSSGPGDRRRACLAAIRGLESIGQARCVTVLEWFGRSHWSPSRPRVASEALLAAARLRARGTGREPVPSSAPGGIGTELQPARPAGDSAAR
jgi:hypothetical protein